MLYLILYRFDATEMGEKSSTCKVSSAVNIVLSVLTLQIDKIQIKLHLFLSNNKSHTRKSKGKDSKAKQKLKAFTAHFVDSLSESSSKSKGFAVDAFDTADAAEAPRAE